MIAIQRLLGVLVCLVAVWGGPWANYLLLDGVSSEVWWHFPVFETIFFGSLVIFLVGVALILEGWRNDHHSTHE